MTTYDGHRPYFIPGMVSKSRDPTISATESDRRYIAHRMNIVNSASRIDNQLHVKLVLPKPQTFMKDLIRRRANMELAERLTKIKVNEGYMTKERRHHEHMIDSMSGHMDRVRAIGRRRRSLLIQYENEQLHRRLDTITPVLTYKQPAVSSVVQDEKPGMKPRPHTSLLRPSHANVPKEFLPSPLTRASSSIPLKASPVAVTVPLFTRRSIYQAPSCAGPLQLRVSTALSSAVNSTIERVRVKTTPQFKKSAIDKGGEESTIMYGPPQLRHSIEVATKTRKMKKKKHLKKKIVSSVSGEPSISSVGVRSSFDNPILSALATSGDQAHEGEVLTTLLSWPVILPGNTGARGVMNVLCKRDSYMDALIFQLNSKSSPKKRVLLMEETIPLESMYTELLDKTYSAVLRPHVLLQHNEALYELLTRQVRDTGLLKSPFCTQEEVRGVLSTLDGILNVGDMMEELLVTEEVDKKGINLSVFIPQASEFIVRHQMRCSMSALMADSSKWKEESLRAIAEEDLSSNTASIAQALMEYDANNSGFVLKAHLKKIFSSHASVWLSKKEINLIIRGLPTNAEGKFSYRYKILQKTIFIVRLQSLKTMIMETQFGDLEFYLFTLLKTELQHQMARTSSPAIAPRLLLHLLLNTATRLHLTEIQALCLTEDAIYISGALDIYTFAMRASLSLKQMFSVEGIQARATSLQPVKDTLNEPAPSDMETRIQSLFEIHDKDHSGGLDFDEFKVLLEHVGGALTASEVASLWHLADVNQTDSITFTDFIAFCSNHLDQLQKERRLHESRRRRQRRKSLEFSEDVSKIGLVLRLISMFEIEDPQRTLILPYGTIKLVMRAALKDKCSNMQVDLLLSEIDEASELLNYHTLLKRTGPLMEMVFQATSSSAIEALSSEYATVINAVEIRLATTSLLAHLPLLSATSESAARVYMISSALKSTAVSLYLNRCESSYLLSALRDPAFKLSYLSLHTAISYAKSLSMLRRLIVPIQAIDIFGYITSELSQNTTTSYEARGSLVMSLNKCIVAILTALPKLTISLGELISVLATSSCIEEDRASNNSSSKDSVVDARAVAYAVSTALSQSHDAAHLGRLYRTCKRMNTSESSILHGLTRATMEHYFRSCFGNAPRSSDLQVKGYLKELPRVKLSCDEIAVILTVLKMNTYSTKLDVEYINESIYPLLLLIRKEVAILRYLPFTQVLGDEPVDGSPESGSCVYMKGISSLMALACKVISVLDLKLKEEIDSDGSQSGRYYLLPPPTDKRKSLPSSSTLVPLPSNMKDEDQQDYEGQSMFLSPQLLSNRRYKIHLPIMIDGNMTNIEPLACLATSVSEESNENKDANSANSKKKLSHAKNILSVHIATEDNHFSVVLPTAAFFSLPSAAIMDADIAEEYIRGLLNSLYVEKARSGSEAVVPVEGDGDYADDFEGDEVPTAYTLKSLAQPEVCLPVLRRQL